MDGVSDGVAIRQDAKNAVVAARVAVFEPDQFVALTGERFAENVVGRGFDAQGIMPGLQVLPFVHGRELRLAGFDLEAETYVFIDQRDVHTIVIRCHIMLPHLFVEVHPRRRQGAVASVLLLICVGVGGPDDILDRGDIARAFGKDRVADIDVIAVHVRRTVKAMIDDAVMDFDVVAADPGFYAADQVQVFAEHRGLLDDAFGPQGADIAVPMFAVTGQPCRNGADAAM